MLFCRAVKAHRRQDHLGLTVITRWARGGQSGHAADSSLGRTMNYGGGEKSDIRRSIPPRHANPCHSPLNSRSPCHATHTGQAPSLLSLNEQGAQLRIVSRIADAHYRLPDARDDYPPLVPVNDVTALAGDDMAAIGGAFG